MDNTIERFLDTARDTIQQYLHGYGLGVLLAGNVFGAGSVYILSNTGANFGYSLLWVLPIALVVDLAMHEMSGRLAVLDRPLMEHIREVIGPTASKPFAIVIAFIMQFWSVANYAVAGAALTWLSPLENVYVGIFAVSIAGIALVELRLYDRIEAVITLLIFVVFGAYTFLLLGLELPISAVVSGFTPLFESDIGYLTMVMALLGTTVYYPNFFIQSSIKPTKQWDELHLYRKDNFFGIFTTIVLSIIVMIVAAATLSEGELMLTAPGEPLNALLGGFALTTFVVAVLLASFTSATGTLFGAGFMVPQAFGKRTVFGDYDFRRTVVSLITVSVVLAIPILHFTGFTPVRLAITMPAVNGIVGLPASALALYHANNRYYDLSTGEKLVFGAVLLVIFGGSVLTAESLYSTLVSYL